MNNHKEKIKKQTNDRKRYSSNIYELKRKNKNIKDNDMYKMVCGLFAKFNPPKTTVDHEKIQC